MASKIALRKVTGLVAHVTYHSSTRRLLTNSKRPTSSFSNSPKPQTVSGRFSPARSGTKIAVQIRQQPQTPAPTRQVPQETKREAPEPSPSSAETLHVHDVRMEPSNGHYWRFAFPSGSCPKRPWWDHLKSAETRPSELRWTSGQMYSHFWKRSGIVLELSTTLSSFLGGAGVLSVISHNAGPAPASACISVFTALALPSFVYGIYRSRILQEAWMGLVGSLRRRTGDSMMPYIHSTAKWEYTWKFRPMDVKVDDIVTFRNPVQHDPRYNTGDVFWLGKRVIALELDVVKMEELGFPDGTYFQVPKGHVFVRGDNRAGSLDSKHFGPIPLHSLRGHTAATTMKSNPTWWDWEMIPKIETTAFTMTDAVELKATRHQWEGKTWDNIPRNMGHAFGKPRYKVKHAPFKVHRRKK